MIWIHKNANPDQTILAMAFFILQKLRSQRNIKITQLLNMMKEKVEGAEYLFLPALDVLFLLGLVVYHIKTDSLEYTGK